MKKDCISIPTLFSGLVIVMSEALSDDSVFSLLMVCTVWEVDQFYSLYCKQITSKLYLPWFVQCDNYSLHFIVTIFRFFFLYHFLPYAYYIRFNGQFWFIPFLFHWFLLQVSEYTSLDGQHRCFEPLMFLACYAFLSSPLRASLLKSSSPQKPCTTQSTATSSATSSATTSS